MDIKQRFRHSIRRGTGEAYLILRDHPAIDFSQDILKVALKNYAYDGQVEGSRADYISRFINLSPKKERMVSRILKALAAGQQDTWALVQLFDLAAIYALEGNPKAHWAIYRRYRKKIISGSAWCGEEALLKSAGIAGLTYIAKVKGQWFLKNRKEWEDDGLIRSFQERNPQIKVYDELQRAAKRDPAIRKYLEVVKRIQASRPRRPPPRQEYNYQRVHENIEKGKVIIPQASRWLSAAELQRLADDFLQETDPVKLEKYLWVFAGARYPYDHQPILQLAKRQGSEENRDVAHAACRALQFVDAGDVRRFALVKLPRTRHPATYLPLLVANYQRGDNRLLEAVVDKCKNVHAFHHVAGACIDIYKANRTKECKGPMELLYGKLTCGHCRRDVVELLYENGVLSSRIRKELEFDSFECIRTLHQKIERERQTKTY